MRQFILFAATATLAAGCWCPSAASAAAPAESSSSANSATPGIALAHATSEITGVAISPMLGVSAVGAWKYFHARTPQQRARLPWFAQPWFWIPAFVLVTACFLKDTVGIAAPRLLKKPLDVADAIEHKISGLIATGAFVPLVIAVFPRAKPEAALPGPNGFLAAIDLSWLGNGLLVPVAMLAFFIVFLASNAINILILLSPFSGHGRRAQGVPPVGALDGDGDRLCESVAGCRLGPDHHWHRLFHCRLVLPPVALRFGLHLGVRHAATQAVSA